MDEYTGGDAIRVLVIEDEEDLRTSLREMLANFAYAVEVAADGVEGLVRYTAFRPHIILLDMNMPRLDGFGVIRRIRETYGDDEVNITMMTSAKAPESKMRAFGSGANDFLYKPFDRAELLARVGVGARQVRLTRRLRRARDEMGREIAHVASLQERLLPQGDSTAHCAACADLPGVHVSNVYRPSGRASGDYFDYFTTHDGLLRVVVADVSGHGARAAFIMGIVRTLFRVSRESGMTLEDTFEQINRHLCDIIGSEEDFVTVLAVDLDVEGQSLSYINAGHCPAFLRHGDNVDELPATASVLGFFRTMPFAETRRDLPPSGGLLLYTDGFYDFEEQGGGFFDFDAFRDVVRYVTCMRGDVPELLQAQIARRSGNAATWRDDATALWVEFGVHGKEKLFTCRANPEASRALVKDAMQELAAVLHDGSLLYDMELALTEACANVVEHAYSGAEPEGVAVSVRIDHGSAVEMDVIDTGQGFEPSAKEDVPQPQAECGRGLYIMRKVMDEVRICSGPGKTLVTLRKTIGKDAWKTYR